MMKFYSKNILLVFTFIFLLSAATTNAQDEVWLEAECGTISSDWSEITNTNASQATFLEASATANLGAAPTNGSNAITSYSFNANAGTYNMFGLTKLLNGSSDSFWIRVNNSEWVKWNVFSDYADSFVWRKVHNQPGTQSVRPVTFSLLQGENNLDIAIREKGAGIDKFYLTKNSAKPEGLGELASNCDIVEQPTITGFEGQIGSSDSDYDPDGFFSIVNGDRINVLNNFDGTRFGFYMRPLFAGDVKSYVYNLTTPIRSVTNTSSASDLIFPYNSKEDRPEGLGDYTLTITPHSAPDGGGIAGASLTVSFELFDSCIDGINSIPIEVIASGTCAGSNGSAIISEAALLAAGQASGFFSSDWTFDTALRIYKLENLAPGTYTAEFYNEVDCYGSKEFIIEENSDCPEPNDFALRINTGGIETDYNGETFIADTYFNTGSTLDRPQTGLPEPYQSMRFSRSKEMSYDISLADGEYTVNLYFTELWFGATGGGSGGVGSRVFDVSIEGQLAEDNLDVFAEVGADAMLMKSHTVSVTGGVLNIDFDSRDAVGGERHPIINAIEILGNDSQLEPMISGFYGSGASGENLKFELVDGGRYDNAVNGLEEFDGVITHNITAITVGEVGSVEFELSGVVELTSEDNSASFAVFPEEGSYFNSGFYMLTATPFSEANLGGIEGAPFTINFEVYNSCDEHAEQSFVITTPSECGASTGTAVLKSFFVGYDDDYIIWSHDSTLKSDVATDLAPGSYSVSVSDNVCGAYLEFEIEEDETCLEPIDFALRINTGGAETDYNGETFVADTYFNTGSTLDRPQTGLPEPFQTFRFSRSQEMSYDIPLEDGEYTVNLYFAELWFGATGGGSGGVDSRVFDVNIEGALAEDNLDIFAEVGADAMLMRSHTVMVTGGVLDIDFDSRDVVGGERHPIINAIEILGFANDSASPVTSISATDVTSISFKVDWTLSSAHTGQVQWGTTTTLGNETILESDFLNQHIQPVRGLEPATTYYYRVIGENAVGASFVGGIRNVKTLAAGSRKSVFVNTAVLSPNPVISTTRLSFEQPVELSDIQVFDVSGRLVRTFKAAEVSVDGAYNLKVHGLESGNYFINAIDNQGVKHQKQMVIKK